MHIIGRGRYAREVYPERSAARLGLLKVGYDQPLDTQLLDIAATVLPRSLIDPLQVQLLGVTPGNVLEVDCTASINNTDEVNGHGIVTIAVVNFGAAPAPFGPGVGWFGIELSLATQLSLPLSGKGVAQLRNFAAVRIPAGAVNATVQIFYVIDIDNTLMIFGSDSSSGAMTTLKVSELSSLTVQQGAPPAFLVPV